MNPPDNNNWWQQKQKMASIYDTILNYLLFVLHSIAISLHCLGIYLLSHQIKQDRSHQVPILMNLSIAEIFMSVFDVAYNIMISYNVEANINIYVYTIQCTCFVISNFLVLTVLALDRFFEVYLNITYPIFITKQVIHRALFGCWSIGFTLGIILCTLRYTMGINTLDVVFRILFPFFEILFFSCAVCSYSYIYMKYRQMSRNQAKTTNNNNSFKKRKFFVPTLIIFTFFLFAIIPDQLHLFLFYIYDIGSNTFLNTILLMYVVGFICDAVIYIFFQKTTYSILRKKLKLLSNKNNVAPETVATDKHDRRGSELVTEMQCATVEPERESGQSTSNFLAIPKWLIKNV